MVHRNIDDIEIPYYLWKRLKPINRVLLNNAFDTETIKGKAFLISDSITQPLHIIDLYTLLQYLNQQSYRHSVNWFYNLEYDTNAILKYLSFDDRKQIAFYNVVDYEDFRITIIPKKELKISKIKKDGNIRSSTVFYDLAQFYNMQPLKVLAEQTQYAKVDVKDISNIDYQKYINDEDYNQLINSRCKIDCLITKELADKHTDKISQVVKINKYKSRASIARRYVLENIKDSLKLPNIRIIQAALDSYHAGHIEAFQLGIFKNVKNYDLNSCYPFFTSELYTTDGAYKHNKEYEPDSTYSFYQVELDYQDDNLSISWFNIHNKNYHPIGKINTWITQHELEFYQDYGYDIKILEAHHLMKHKYHEQPFMELINDLYDKRLQAKKDGDPIEYTYKIILNSIYGVTMNIVNKKEISYNETNNFIIDKNGEMVFYKDTFKATNMFNPLFGCYITAQPRVKIRRDFNKNLSNLIDFNTDGVLLTKGNGVKISKKMGDYSFTEIPKIMVLGSGRNLKFGDNGVDNKESRFRSIPKKPSDIYEMMKCNCCNDSLEIIKDKPIKLKESVKIKKYYDKFNEFRSVPKNVCFKVDRRYWYDQFDNISEIWDKVIESRPFDVQELI